MSIIKKKSIAFWKFIVRVVYSRIFNRLILVLVFISITSLLSDKLFDFSNRVLHFLDVMDYVIVIIFAFEFIVKLLSAKTNYFFKKYGWIDFLSSLPILAPAIKGLKTVRLLRVTRILRVLRILKLSKETPSPLKQKFFTALSSISLIVIMTSGYIIYEYQFAIFEKNMVKDIKRILNSVSGDKTAVSFFKNYDMILRLTKFDLTKKPDFQSGDLRLQPSEEILGIRIPNEDIFEKNIPETKEYKILRDNLGKNFDFDKLSGDTRTQFLDVWERMINNYFPHKEKVYTVKADLLDYIDYIDFKEEVMLQFVVDRKYRVVLSFRDSIRELKYFEAFIIFTSIFSVIFIVMVLNVYFEKVLLDKVTRVSNEFKEILAAHQLKGIETFDKEGLDEIDYLVRSYVHLREQINDSFLKKNSYIKMLETFNAVYTNFQSTFDLDRLFNYFIITLTCKNYLRYDRAVLFIYNKEKHEYQPQYSIGCSDRDTLKGKFNPESEFFEFNPTLEESFNLYKNLPYYDETFTSAVNEIVIPEEEFNNVLIPLFEKERLVKFPTEIKIKSDFVNNINEKIGTKSFLLGIFKEFDETFGLVYMDNAISNEDISKDRKSNTDKFVTEFLKIFHNIIYLNFIVSISKETELIEKVKLEKEKSIDILTKIFKFIT